MALSVAACGSVSSALALLGILEMTATPSDSGIQHAAHSSVTLMGSLWMQMIYSAFFLVSFWYLAMETIYKAVGTIYRVKAKEKEKAA